MSATGQAVRLLLIEDDPDLGVLLGRILGEDGYTVELAPDGREGLQRMLTESHDVVVLDRGLPGMEGTDLLRAGRASHVTTPVLILSARGDVHERVHGLESGAEDYLTKPFDVGELLARLRVLLRRGCGKTRWLSFGGLRLDTVDQLVTRSGSGEVVAALSEREASLLALLAAHPGQLFDRAELRERVFTDAASDAAVDSYVHYCRRKLGDDVIVTVRSYGFRIGSP